LGKLNILLALHRNASLSLSKTPPPLDRNRTGIGRAWVESYDWL